LGPADEEEGKFKPKNGTKNRTKKPSDREGRGDLVGIDGGGGVGTVVKKFALETPRGKSLPP